MPRTRCFMSLNVSMVSGRMMNMSIFSTSMMTFMINNISTIIILNSSFALHKVRNFLSLGNGFSVVFVSRLEANTILNARASPIVKHATSKFKFLNFWLILINLSIYSLAM
jgi:hypothetical protein